MRDYRKYVSWVDSKETRTVLEFMTYRDAFEYQKNIQGAARRRIKKGKGSCVIKTQISPIVWRFDDIRFILCCEKIIKTEPVQP